MRFDVMSKSIRKADYDLILYLILLPAFFLLHGHNAFFGLLPFDLLLTLFVTYFALAASLFF